MIKNITKTMVLITLIALMADKAHAVDVNVPSPLPIKSNTSINNKAYTIQGRDYGRFDVVKRGYKKGVASCTSYLGIVVKGDCGIGNAIEAGGLNELRYVDYKKKGWIFKRNLIVEAYGN